MMKKYRHECKFLLNAVDAELVRNQISSICLPDTHTDFEGQYYVRSLYFDTIDDLYLNENLAGVNCRHKYRIRIYNFDKSRISLERKETELGLKHKESCLITETQCNELLHGNVLIEADDNQVVLKEMGIEHMLRFLKPKVIVDYLRIPYIYPAGNVRITFDHHVASSVEVEGFFERDIITNKVLNDNSVVFEVKYDDFLPYAIRRIINRFANCEQTAFSKYVYARENVKNG